MAKRSVVAMRQATAAIAFIEGKTQEFLGHLELENAEGVERCRVELHALLDMRLDGIQSAAIELRKEMEIEQRKRGT